MAEAISKNELMARRIAVFLFFALAFIEFFIDPFPDSFWPLRILSTKYSAVVTANLTIDGEPLVLTRKIRCFASIDYIFFLAPSWGGGLRIRSRQAGDTLAGTTSKGRLFAINVPDACGALNKNGGNGMFLSEGDIETPVVFEIHGGKKATQIDAYIARDLLRTGYHGVQLNELIVDYSDAFQLIDWTGYDWFGPPDWFREENGDGGRYRSVSILSAPIDRWTELEKEFNFSSYPEDSQKKYNENKKIYWSSQTDIFWGGRDFWPNPFSVAFEKWRPGMLGFGLILQEKSYMQDHEKFSWMTEGLVPCIPDEKENLLKCREDLKGILVYTKYLLTEKYRKFSFLNTEFDLKEDLAIFLRVNPRAMYGVDIGEAWMKEGW